MVVVVVGLGTIVLKALGPVLLGARPLPPRVDALVAMLAPTLLAALVVTQTVGDGNGVSADARIVGVGSAMVAIALRAPLVLVVLVAASATALVRAFA